MRYQIDHDYHIHSFLSSCSNDPRQHTQYIVSRAAELGLSRIVITDHYWDSEVPGAPKWYLPQNFEHISTSLPLPTLPDVTFSFGCETELSSECVLACPSSRFDAFDFIVIPTTHLHIVDRGAPAEGLVARRAHLWVERLERVLDMPLPFHKIGIAHLSSCLVNWKSKSMEEYLATLAAIPEEDMERLFARAAALGCGIELNLEDMRKGIKSDLESVLRPFRVAKACGCKFYLGSDAHLPEEFDGFHEIYSHVITALDLTENDKFHIGGHV